MAQNAEMPDLNFKFSLRLPGDVVICQASLDVCLLWIHGSMLHTISGIFLDGICCGVETDIGLQSILLTIFSSFNFSYQTREILSEVVDEVSHHKSCWQVRKKNYYLKVCSTPEVHSTFAFEPRVENRL